MNAEGKLTKRQRSYLLLPAIVFLLCYHVSSVWVSAMSPSTGSGAELAEASGPNCSAESAENTQAVPRANISPPPTLPPEAETTTIQNPDIQEQDLSKWGEGITEFLSQLQEGPAKSLQDFQEEVALLKDTLSKECKEFQATIHQIEEATRAFEEGKTQLTAYQYKAAHTKLVESANNYELALKSLPSNSSLVAMVCYNLGQVYTHLTEWQGAEEVLLKAMDIQRLFRKEKDLANIYNSLGIIHLKKVNKEAVPLYFEESVNLARQIGSLQVEGVSLGNLGMFYYLRGNLEKALQAYEAAIKIQSAPGGLGQHLWEAKYLSNQALIYHHQGKLEQALHLHNKALKINREFGYKKEAAGNLGNMGIIYNFQEKWEEALNTYNAALKIHRELGLRNEEAKDMGNIGIVYQSQGRLRDALSAHKESLQIHKMLGNLRGEAKDLNNIAVIYQAQGKAEEALKAYEEAYNLFLFLKASVEVEVVKENIARIKAQIGDKR